MKHKVLLVLLLGVIISVSASAQKVTMNLKQVKLEKVFSAITQQTGLLFRIRNFLLQINFCFSDLIVYVSTEKQIIQNFR